MNQDSFLTADDLEFSFRVMNLKFGASDVQEILEVLDLNNDDRLDFDEFAKGFELLAP